MEFYSSLQNAYPSIHGRVEDLEISVDELRKSLPIDSREVFDYIRDIRDPEHPLTLEELGVVQLENIKVVDKTNECDVEFTPTIPHCSMATLIGLAIKVQLLRILPRRFKIEVRIEPGTHNQEIAVNKQLADKERVAAALENSHLRNVLDDCILLPEEQELPKSIQQFLEEEKIFDNPKIKYVLQSRQPVKTFRRWLDIANERSCYNSLVNGCKSMKIGCCGGSSCG